MKRAARIAASLLAVALVSLTSYGTLVEPRLILDEEHYTMTLPRLGPELDGTTIAVISDLQVGMWWANTGMVARAARDIVDARPDAVLLAGDFVYSTDPGIAKQTDMVLELLAPLLDSGIPAFAVMGNHDHKSGAAAHLSAALEQHGVDVLDNESAILLPRAGLDAAEQLHVVGIGLEIPGLADADQALEGVPGTAPRVVLMHNPTTFPTLPAGTAPLAIAGHTHCGQISLPGSPHWSYLDLTKEEEIVADGFALDGYGAPGNELFVTCGIGFSLMPVRIGAAPQVVYFELEAGRGTR